MVLPEDDADRHLANGFLLHPDVMACNVQILEEAGGWNAVVERFLKDHVSAMRRYPQRYMVLLLDFDGNEGRRKQVRAKIPDDLSSRVFILGVLHEPEDLKGELGSYERIGSMLAQDCRDGTDKTWCHALLSHNKDELVVLRQSVLPVLFPVAKPSRR